VTNDGGCALARENYDCLSYDEHVAYYHYYYYYYY